MMEKKIARTFNDKVSLLVPDENDREKLYESLRNYQGSHNLVSLLKELQRVINEPDRIELYDEIRPLIPLKHQVQYDSLTPPKPSMKLRVIRLKGTNNDGLGFTIRGGLEHGTGVYVSHVKPGSQAQRQGLKVGDEIVRLNGFAVNQAIHEEVLNLIKARDELVLKVRYIGMLPVKEHITERLSWKYIESMDPEKALQQILDGDDKGTKKDDNKVMKVFINVGMASGLGCSICSGPSALPGIFLQSIKLGSLAQEVGLEVGDQILEVNGVSFEDIDHTEAVVTMKSTKQLHLTIKKGAGLELFQNKGVSKTALEEQEEEKALQLKKLLIEREQEKFKVTDPEGKILEEDKEAQRKAEEEEWAKLEQTVSQIERRKQDKNGTNTLQPSMSALPAGEIQVSTNGVHQIAVGGTTTNGKSFQEPKEDIESTEHELFRSEVPKNHAKQQKEHQVVSVLMKQQNSSVQRENELKEARYQQERAEIQREQDQQAGSTGPSRGLTYMSAERTPSFRIQKPVLLCPYPRAGHDGTSPTTKEPGSPLEKEDGMAIFEEEEAEENIYMDIDDVNPNRMFTNEEIAGRHLQVVHLKKEGPLGMVIEGGKETHHKGVIVSGILPGGSVHKQGTIRCGDQILMIEDHHLTDVTLTEAQRILKDTLESSKPTIKLVLAEALPPEQELITYL